ncbi:tetratricopeptide repeat protein [Sphingobium algorifonticola]|uniref:Tetratricopeptide repeat protein n=1 Tax=Sphingobium algorifonticola TaxID=2008318 RepID=A0A437J6Q6_9SPHN|nr:tetratricopeptide repeat protein [Sphingobium algorifonticola]RVT40830.1 tetratricopeptide repeat protein [Sphingobium algorifonticola]
MVDTPALHAYARARLADADGAGRIAVDGYATALAADPGNAVLALRSYRQAMEAGDRVLAVKAARVLDSAGVLPRDAVLLLIVESLSRKDWDNARALADRLEAEETFAFLAPYVASWVSVADGPYAPPEIDTKSAFGALAGRYRDEHVALQALARGDVDAARPAIARALSLRTDVLPGLRVALALRLAALGQRAEADKLLDLAEPGLAPAQALLANGARITAPPMTPQQGMARLLSRLAADVGEGDSRTLALNLARLASFADPASDEMRVGIARELAASGLYEPAIAEASKVPPRSLWAAAADALRIAALAQGGQQSEALQLARAATTRDGATAAQYLQLGNLLADAGQFGDAADAYRAAQRLYPDGTVPWSLHLLEGSALERGGRWDEAKRALTRAAELAPQEPVVLNYLGYAQVERRQNVPAALALLRKASALRPDDPSISDSLGWAHFVAGDAKSAIAPLEKAASGAPDDATINEHLGDALWAVGRRFEARYAWAAAGLFAEGPAADRINAKAKAGFRPELAAP